LLCIAEIATVLLMFIQNLKSLVCSKSSPNKKSQSNLGRASSLPLMLRMDSSAACATSYSVHTIGESNHSAADTLHPHCSTTCYLYVRPILHCPIPLQKKFAPSHLGLPLKKACFGPPNPPPQTVFSACTLNFCYYWLCMINWSKLTISQCEH